MGSAPNVANMPKVCMSWNVELFLMNKRTELAVDIVLGLAYTAATVLLLRIFYEALIYVPADY